MTSIFIFIAIAVVWEASAWIRSQVKHRQRMQRINAMLDASTQDMQLVAEFLKMTRTEEDK